MRMSKQREQLLRGLKRESPLVRATAQQAEAVGELLQCYEQWEDADTVNQELRSKRIRDAVYREVERIQKEIYQGKTKQVSERFQRAVEQILASRPRRTLTYLQTLDALQVVMDSHREWYESAPHSRVLQNRARRLVHEALQEVMVGHIEQFHERLVERLEALSTEEQDRHESPSTNAQ